ncbi:TPA: hypothetical protein STY81_003027 [Clostridioides difficile]|nr:hypothetical protein [Clostridioides difficile]HEK4832656.1 hypothetical protein [Clostridioides difficile]HEK4935293.1 hypothetical protein [Clostridioides difficile]HEK4988181.1 hypothetical protein [Clostridioides difficile]HEK5048330.1 hypothetical protein [Clostridioides difficile]
MEIRINNTGDWNIGNHNTGDCNMGNNNAGNCNVGNGNTSNHNAGDRNARDYNVGDWNTGDWNRGYGNVGDKNTGNRNTGDRNTGDYNVGDKNTGDWNTGNWNAGIFCTDIPKLRMFNKETDLTYIDWMNSRARHILKNNSNLTKWVNSKNMSDKEKKNNPEHEITGGYLKIFTFKEMCKNMWSNLTDEEKKIIMEIPNFDRDIFQEITGINTLE